MMFSHWAGSALNLAKEVEKYRIKWVALLEVRLEESGTVKISQTTIFKGKCEMGHNS